MTADVLLRSVIADDIPIFYEHQRDVEATRMAAFPTRERDAFTAHWAKILRDETVITKTIIFDGEVAGNIVSFEMECQRKVGYWIGKSYWGKGIASQALSEFLKHVKIRPLYAHVAKHNIGSLRVLEKNGFLIYGEDTIHGEEIKEFILRLD